MESELLFAEQKYHQTELRISFKALHHNYSQFLSFLKEGTDIMLMIKAGAYGHGAVALAKAFEKEKRIGYFAVAYVDEGIKLRKAGIRKPILVLNPSENAFPALIENCLEPEIHNLQALNDFIGYLSQFKKKRKPYPVHLKFNTGMNRLGMNRSEIDELKSNFKQQSVVEIRSLMTHLSSSNLPKEDEFSQMQLGQFEQIIEDCSEIVSEDTFYHCLNSNGIFRFPDHHYQMVRLGIGFYGSSTVKDLKFKLKPAACFVSRIAQIRKVKKGDSISYSRSGRAATDTQIATLSIGYADGFNRLLGNGRWQVEIKGELYPTIGNICMDLSMIDIGEADLQTGDEVIIFGGQKDVYDFASALGTITYEVMCSIGPRVKRIISA